MHVRTFPLFFLFALLSAVDTHALQCDQSCDDFPDRVTEAINLVNEVGVRRQLGVLFPNPGPVSDGVYAAYTHTHTGTLAFGMRDLVLPARMPIIVRRLYDSSHIDGDFGPGWRLSFSESIQLLEDGVVYVDMRGTERKFVPSSPSNRYVLQSKEPGWDKRYLHRHNKGFVLWTYEVRRWFKPAGDSGRFRLSRLEDGYGNAIDLQYNAQGQLSSVSNDVQKVELSWNSDGQVDSISDSTGRTVRYRYDRNGYLKNHRDSAGERWRYKYRRGRLAETTSPDGATFFSTKYDNDGLVRSVKEGGIETSFRYLKNDRTRITKSGVSAVIHHNSDGVAHRLVRGNFVQRLVLNDDASVRTLVSKDRDDESPPTRLRLKRSGPSTITSDYIGLSPSGDIQELYDEKNGHHFLLNADERGLVTSIVNGDEAVDGGLFLTYNERGLLEFLSFSNGHTRGYAYDERGFRLQSSSVEAAVRYQYTNNGELSNVTGKAQATDMIGMDVVTNNEGLVESVVYSDGQILRFEYNEASDPIKVYDDSDFTLLISYDPVGRLSKFTWPDNESFEYIYADNEPDIRWQSDTEALLAPIAVSFGRDALDISYRFESYATRARYETVGFDEGLIQFVVANETLNSRPTLKAEELVRSRVIDAIQSIYVDQPSKFEQPSNDIFQPPEYARVNCCFDFYDFFFDAIPSCSADIYDFEVRRGRSPFDVTEASRALAATVSPIFIPRPIPLPRVPPTVEPPIMMEEDSSDQVEESDRPGNGVEAPGDCGVAQHRDLQIRVDNSCKVPRRCRSTDSCSVLRQRIEQNSMCIASRNRINSACFRGGDDGHAEAVENAQNALQNCQLKLLDKCVGEIAIRF